MTRRYFGPSIGMLNGLGHPAEELTDAKMPGRIYSTPTPIVTRRGGLRGLGLAVLGQDLVEDPSGNVYDASQGPAYTGPDYSAFTGDTPTDTQTPLATEVIAPAGTSPQDAAASAASGMANGETRTVTMSDGSTIRVVAASAPPASPDANTWYKVGAMLLRATGQLGANGQPVYVQTPIPGAGGNLFLFALLAGAAVLLLS